jgi:hypothetical protein
MYAIIRGPEIRLADGTTTQSPGLGSIIKDELGSYVVAAISATHSDYPEEVRKLIENPEALLRLRWSQRRKEMAPQAIEETLFATGSGAGPVGRGASAVPSPHPSPGG